MQGVNTLQSIDMPPSSNTINKKYETLKSQDPQDTPMGPNTIGNIEIEIETDKVRRPKESLITKDTFTAINQNKAHGHSIENQPAATTMRIYHQNIRGAKTYQNWNRWKEGTEQLVKWDVGIALLVETNTQWTQINKSAAQAMTHSITSQSKLCTSGSTEATDTDFQPGGTACVALGKWTGRITTRITDVTGLGRWSGFQLQGKNMKSLIVLSAYRPTNSCDPSDRTCYSQQWRILRGRNSNSNSPNPRQAFVDDLTKQIHKWKEQGTEIIIGIDANETETAKHSQIAKLIQDTSLELLVDTAISPATFTRGTKPIDFIIGTIAIKRATIANGYLPFYSGAWDSDHRGLFIDVNISNILGGVVDIDKPPTRILQSSNRIMARKFLTKLGNDKKLIEIHQNILAMKQKPKLTTDDKQRLEQMDQQFTKTLLKAEKKCKNNHNHPWSEALHQLNITYQYWKTHQKGLSNKINTDAKKLELLHAMKEPNQQWQGDESRPSKNQLIRAKKALKAVRDDAWEYRRQFTIDKERGYRSQNNAKDAKILGRIRRAETRRQGLRIQKSITKPQAESGGLTHILITDDTVTKRIDDKLTMHTMLHQQNISHFSQAKNAPCVAGLLAEMLGNNGVTKVSNEITHRRYDTSKLPTTIAEICNELQKKRDTQSAYMPMSDMIEGFNKWRERTTTSPSGKHLGIYRTLTRAVKHYYEIPTTDQNKPEPNQSKKHRETAELALTIQNHLINLAIKHTYSYLRWKTINNFFIEKIPGNPLLGKLRVIHIYEADWNLLLKYFIAYKVHGAACRAQTVQPEQTGGRPGKCTAHTAALTTITAETICLQKVTGATIYNDAKACFDRIIENISNATLISEGLHPKIAKIHHETLSNAHYYIKTKQGLHDIPNGHMKPDHFLGSGQGAADSMPRWSIQSDLLIRLYNAKAISNPIICPISKAEMLEKIRAFVDDTNSLSLCKGPEELEKLLTENATIWENLLHLIGGKLELSKCKFTTYQWHADSSGTMKLVEAKTIGALTIIDSETKLTNEIEEIAINESYKLLGIPMATTQAYIEQEQMIRNKCTNMKKLLTSTNLPPVETWNSYKAIILPTIKYGLAATVIPEAALASSQKQLIHALIPRLGMNRHTPLAVIQATNALGGVGIQDLPTEQGIAHVAFLIGSIRCNTEASRSIYGLLESYIITSGLIGSPLKITKEIKYVTAPWLDTTRAFMEKIHLKITTPKLHTLHTLRQRDQGIMAMASEYTTNTLRLTAINNCRLYLQVHSMAEITTMNGREILREAYTGDCNQNMSPKLHELTQSKLNWPIQDKPPPMAWRIWKKMLRTKLRGNTLALKHKLSEWNHNKDDHRSWTPDDTTRRPPKPRQGERHTKWKQSIEKKIIGASALNIVINSENKRNTCTYAWEIIIENTKVAHHRGVAMGHQDQGNDRGELIGIQTALKRIETIHQNWSTSPKPKLLTIWTEKESVAKVLKMLRYRLTTATTAIEDEAEAKIEIGKMLESHPGYQVKIVNNETEKSIKESCEALEARITETNESPCRRTDLCERATVTINMVSVTANLQNRLRTESTKIQYHNYLMHKYCWTQEIINKIDWETVAHAMAVLPPKIQKTTKQLIHGWLPTNGHPGANAPNTPFCPRCNAEIETNRHFLVCQRDRQQWAEKFMKKNERQSEPEIHRLLIETIGNLLNNQEINLPEAYSNIEETQNQIGWRQMLNGRWTKLWASTYDMETGTNKGIEWAATQIRSIWRHIHERWRERCALEHNDEAVTTANQELDLNCRLTTIYNQQNNLEETDRRLFKRTLDEMKALTITEKAAWIKRTKVTISKGIKRVKKQQAHTNNIITRYYQVRQQIAKQNTPTRRQHKTPPSTDTNSSTGTGATTNTGTSTAPSTNYNSNSGNTTYQTPSTSKVKHISFRGALELTRYGTPRTSSLRKFRRNPKIQKENLDPH
jgi:hypothetical protein